MSSTEKLYLAALKAMPAFGAERWEIRAMARRAARARQMETVSLCEHRVLATVAQRRYVERHGRR